MTLPEAVLLGVIQGLTEFLPISSTAHLIAVRTWLGHADPKDAFTTAIQLGTLAAVLAYFRRELVGLVGAVARDTLAGRFAATPDSRLAWLIALGSVPVVVVGGLYAGGLRDTFYNVPSIGVVATVFALLMLAADVWARRRGTAPVAPPPADPEAPRNLLDRLVRGAREPAPPAPPGLASPEPAGAEARVTVLQAVLVGCWQALALMPGASRSGTTITGGLFAGMTRAAAARFSFLLSLPSVFGAGVKDLYGEYKLVKKPDPAEHVSLFASPDDVAALAVGTLVAAAVGYLAIAGLLRFLTRHSLGVFVGYRLVFGAVLLGWWYFGR